MLRAVGMGDDDWDKPQVAIASSWNEVTPCNMTLRKLAEHAKAGVRAAGGFALEFGTITVSDGISMGHEGMRASLVSREVITDSVETVMHAERLDGFVGLAGCDKSIPGMLMAAARLDLPACSSTTARSCRASTTARRSTSPRCSKRSARTPPARSTTQELHDIERRRARVRVPAAACSPPTR